MKKIKVLQPGIAAILLLAAVFSGCRNDKQKATDIETGYEIIVIDSCQYIVSKSPRGDYGWVMSHKGNCKFCASRHSR